MIWVYVSSPGLWHDVPCIEHINKIIKGNRAQVCKKESLLLQKKGDLHKLLRPRPALHDSTRHTAHAPVGGSPGERGGRACTTVLKHGEPPHLHATAVAAQADDHADHRRGEGPGFVIFVMVLVPRELCLS